MNNLPSKSRRLLITGGSGDLGRVLCPRAVTAGHEVTTTYLSHPERLIAGAGIPYQLDLTDKNAVQEALDTIQPEVIIHTALSGATPNPRQQIVAAAFHLRTFTPRTTRLIFLSTDMVFDGSKAPYADDAPPSPITPYGQAKAEMEMMADQVVRTSLIYDFVPGNRQVDWMLEKISRGEPCRLFVDEYRSAVWVVNLADVLLELIDSIFIGVLNVAGPQTISRFELGRGLLLALGYPPDKHIEPVSQAGSGRQPNLTLDVTKARMILKTPLLNFEDAQRQWEASVASRVNGTGKAEKPTKPANKNTELSTDTDMNTALRSHEQLD